MGLQQNIGAYCRFRNQQFRSYCSENGLQLDANAQRMFFESERIKVDGQPNPVFKETMKFVSAYVDPIPNKVNLYSILRGPQYKDFLTLNGLQDTPESKSSFFNHDMLKDGQPNPEFLSAISYANLMSETEVRRGAEIYASIKKQEYQQFLAANQTADGLYSKAKFFTQQRDAGKAPNSDFKETMKIVSVIKEHAETASKYAQARQTQYQEFITEKGMQNSPEAIASFFVKEREKVDGQANPVFVETLSKILSPEKTATATTVKVQDTPTPVAEAPVVAAETVVDQNVTPSASSNTQTATTPASTIEKDAPKITPRQDFKNMSMDKLTAYVRFGINDNGPQMVPYLSGGMGSITEEVIPAAMEYLSRQPNMASIELKDLNGIDLNITKDSTLEGLASQWEAAMQAKVAEAQARREAEASAASSTIVSESMRAKYGDSYDLDGIAAGPNPTEVLSDLPAFDNLAKGQAMTQDQTQFVNPTADPMLTQTITTNT